MTSRVLYGNINIVDFYLYKQDFKELITRINNFLKRKSIDDEIILTIADRLFNAAIKDNKVKLRYEKVAEKAVSIYVKFEKKLSKKRKENLALIYTYGLGVDINLDKAKEFDIDVTQF